MSTFSDQVAAKEAKAKKKKASKKRDDNGKFIKQSEE